MQKTQSDSSDGETSTNRPFDSTHAELEPPSKRKNVEEPLPVVTQQQLFLFVDNDRRRPGGSDVLLCSLPPLEVHILTKPQIEAILEQKKQRQLQVYLELDRQAEEKQKIIEVQADVIRRQVNLILLDLEPRKDQPEVQQLLQEIRILERYILRVRLHQKILSEDEFNSIQQAITISQLRDLAHPERNRGQISSRQEAERIGISSVPPLSLDMFDRLKTYTLEIDDLKANQEKPSEPQDYLSTLFPEPSKQLRTQLEKQPDCSICFKKY